MAILELAYGLFQQHPVLSVAGCAFFLLFVHGLASYIRTEQKIKIMGGRGHVWPQYIPFGLRLISTSIKSMKEQKDVEWWNDMFNKYGPKTGRKYNVESTAFGRRLVFTADEDNIKTILTSNFADFGKGTRFNELWREFLGDSIFSSDGERWHDSRQLLRTQFVKDKVADLNTFEYHAQVMFRLLEGSRPGHPVDIVEPLFRFTMDATTEFLFGESVNAQSREDCSFAEAFDCVQKIQSLIARSGPLSFLINRTEFRKALKTVDDMITPYIERTLALSAEELEKQNKSSSNFNFLHSLAGYTRDRKVLRDQLVATLLAGRDTTSSTMCWMWYEIAKNPHVYERLRQEILSIVGSDGIPTYENLKAMKHLTHTINETLRLYPILPYNIRVALRDTTLPRGGGPEGKDPIGILEGDQVLWSTRILHARDDIYEPHPKDWPHHTLFRPERWDNWTPRHFTYIPFNAGPRVCVGQHFAMTEMQYVTCRLIQTFSRLESCMEQEPSQKVQPVMSPGNAINIVFHRDGLKN